MQKESSRGRHREKEDIKITKERTPESEEENGDWETNREGKWNAIKTPLALLQCSTYYQIIS